MIMGAEAVGPRFLLALFLLLGGTPVMAGLSATAFGASILYPIALGCFVTALMFCVPMLRDEADEEQDAFRRMDALAAKRERQASTW